VLKQAGDSLVRDSLDKRIINEIRTGTAAYGKVREDSGKGILSSQNDVGGWPVLNSRPAPTDSDHDGMPDQWERNNGLNPENPKDEPQHSNDSNYTNLERYLNSLVPAEK